MAAPAAPAAPAQGVILVRATGVDAPVGRGTHDEVKTTEELRAAFQDQFASTLEKGAVGKILDEDRENRQAERREKQAAGLDVTTLGTTQVLQLRVGKTDQVEEKQDEFALLRGGRSRSDGASKGATVPCFPFSRAAKGEAGDGRREVSKEAVKDGQPEYPLRIGTTHCSC